MLSLFSFSLSLSLQLPLCSSLPFSPTRILLTGGPESTAATAVVHALGGPVCVSEKWRGDGRGEERGPPSRGAYVSDFVFRMDCFFNFFNILFVLEFLFTWHRFCRGAFTSCRTINSNSIVMWQHHCERLLFSLDSCDYFLLSTCRTLSHSPTLFDRKFSQTDATT